MNRLVQLLAVLTLTSVGLSAPGQVVAIQMQYDNVLSLCEDNWITIAVDGLKSSSLRVTTNNGTITPAYPSGTFIIKPVYPKPAIIYVDERLPSGKFKRLSEQYLRVKYATLREPYLLSVDGDDTITRNRLYNCDITTDIRGFVSVKGLPITGFTVIAKRKREIIYKTTITNKPQAHIDSNTRKFFYKLLNNDSLIFSDVRMQYCNGSDTMVAGTVFGYVIRAPKTEDDPYMDFEKGIIIEDPITGEVYERVTPFTNRPVKSTSK